MTTGSVGAGYAYEQTLGYLLPSGGAGRLAIFACVAAGENHFLSHDGNCEGQTPLGRLGFAYAAPPAGVPTAAVWRCRRTGDHFASLDPACEGQTTESRLGYLPVRGAGLVRAYAPGANRHWVSAAPVPGGYRYERTLGYLLEAGGAGRTALYSCRAGADDQFLSLDPGCEGRKALGREGFLYAAPPATEPTVPLYRCVGGGHHFATTDPGCEGRRTEALLGWLRARTPALQHYANSATGTQWVTTGPPGPGYRYVRTLGFLVETGGAGLQALYDCRSGAEDHFLSLDPGCESRTSEGRAGFAFATPPAGEETVALYRCSDPGRSHFASLDPTCGGQIPEGRLGYVRTVDQGPPPPPSCGPSGAVVEASLSGRARRTVRYGRPVAIAGRALLPGGTPAAGATVLILAGDSALTEVTRAVAGADGSFRAAVPPGTSRTVRAAFRAAAGDAALACSPTARVVVRAKGRLRARPHRLRAGRVVRFRGRIAGPLPAGGKLLDLQAFDGGRWRKFATTRTRRGGSYRARYRFTRLARAKVYRFRVRIPREAGFPYATGRSNVVKVRVRRR